MSFLVDGLSNMIHECATYQSAIYGRIGFPPQAAVARNADEFF